MSKKSLYIGCVDRRKEELGVLSFFASKKKRNLCNYSF